MNTIHTNSTVLVQILTHLLGRLTFCIRSFSSRNRIFENTSLGILTSLDLSSVELQQSSVAESSNSGPLFPPALALIWGRCNTYDAVGPAGTRMQPWVQLLVSLTHGSKIPGGSDFFLRPLTLLLEFGWRSKQCLKCLVVVETKNSSLVTNGELCCDIALTCSDISNVKKTKTIMTLSVNVQP